jgi:predicted outer membrane repeat protein
MRLSLLFALWLFGSTLGLAQTVRYVSTTGTNTNPATATSWATSTPDLQGAIQASAVGDQVWVGSGLYKPTTTTGPDSRTISFTLKEGVTVYGGFTGTETTLSQRPSVNPNTLDGLLGTPSSTTLSGDIGTIGDHTDNSYHVVVDPVTLQSGAVLDGFVITGGNANGQNAYNTGGGIFLVATISTAPLHEAAIRNCLLYGNKAGNGGAFSGGFSGRTEYRIPVLSNCRFAENTAQTGGAIYMATQYTFMNCTFEHNTAVSGGVVTGVVSGSNSTGSTFLNSIFRNNSATNGGVAYSESGTIGASIVCYNSIFESNTATNGGVFYSTVSQRPVQSGFFTNCSFRGNSASQSGAVAYVGGSVATRFTNSILWDNGGANTLYNAGPSSGHELQYSLVEPSVTGYSGNIGNINTTVSPFVSPVSFQLATCSPAINAASPVWYFATSLTTDLAGNPRFRNGLLDMGAYQADLSGANGMVSVQNGNWNDVGTWSCGSRLPLVGETVGIRHTVTLPTNYTSTSAQLSYGPNGQLRLSEAAQLQTK